MLARCHFVEAKSRSSSLLDLLRFFAALSVAVYHWQGNTPVLHPVALSHQSLMMKMYLDWVGAGYQFVMVFFVLSGLLISSSVLRAVKDGRWSWKIYLVNRLTRLWVVLLPALVLAFVLGELQKLLFGNLNFSGAFGVKTLFLNAGFLQDRFAPVYGGDDPLWSLSYEFWYYILFPCVVLSFVSRRVSLRVMYVTISLAIFALIGVRMSEYFLVWMLGCGVLFMRPLRIRQTWLWYVAIVVALLTMFVFYQVPYIAFHVRPSLATSSIYPDFILSLSVALLIYVIRSEPVGAERKDQVGTWAKAFASLAGFSYTLYLVHYPAIYLVTRLLLTPPARPLYALVFSNILLSDVVFATFICLYAWVISRFTEARTAGIRGWVTRSLSSRSLGAVRSLGG